MVKLINRKNLGLVSNIAYKILKIQEKMTHIVEFNNPNIEPCIYVMWHSNQFCVHGFPNRNKVNILISNSVDGEIIARVCEKWGFGVCRGSSKKKGAVSGTLKLIEKLKDGQSVSIMVDGPSGPIHKVKSGAIRLAKDAGVPIIPVHWYSPQKTFAQFPSWDKMKSPIGFCKILNTYGEPIYTGEKSDEELAEEIKNALFQLEAAEKENYNKAKALKLWEKKK